MSDMLLTPKAVAEKLSFSMPTVYRLIDSGQLPVVKIGAGQRGALRVRESELEKLIKNNTERRGTLKRNYRASVAAP